jgi:hypothetical protein
MAHYSPLASPVLQIVWPENWIAGNAECPYFMVTVDGVHRFEPKHPKWSKNPQMYSRKHNRSAVNYYELGIAIWEDRLVWISGPHPASMHDGTIFRIPGGRKDKIPAGKRVVADSAYRGSKDVVSLTNPRDTPDVRKTKSRARTRHEGFNKRLKVFESISARFRHGVAQHEVVFEAVCVIAHYQMELGSPLFDV